MWVEVWAGVGAGGAASDGDALAGVAHDKAGAGCWVAAPLLREKARGKRLVCADRNRGGWYRAAWPRLDSGRQ